MVLRSQSSGGDQSLNQERCCRFSPIGSGPPDGRDRASKATWTFKLSWPSTMTASSLDFRVSPRLQQHLKVLWVRVGPGSGAPEVLSSALS